MKLTLGFSPCPNDCFIFDALVNERIDLQGYEFDVVLEDVESLNRLAQRGQLDITKLSYFAFFSVVSDYVLLRSGGAMGYGCGPLLITKKHYAGEEEIRTVAIPGKMTTANFLLSVLIPEITDKKEYVFSQIEDAVLSDEVDAGLIIHENRFTYAEKGLKKVTDLGERWEKLTSCPIPLGGIAMHRKHSRETRMKINELIRKSVDYAFQHPEASMPFVKHYADTMSEEVMKQHIALYVNEFTRDLGTAGGEAINQMYLAGNAIGLIRERGEKMFVDSE